MLRAQDVSVLLLTLAFTFTFLGAFIGLPFAVYMSALCFIASLSLYKRITPKLFISLLVICFFLFLVSPSTYMLAALFPLVGFFFSGKNKSSECNKLWVRYSLWLAVVFMYLAVLTQGSDSSNASHNQLSEIIAFIIIAELLYFSEPSKLYIPLIFISFLYVGNRSAFFLLAAYIKNKLVLSSFIVFAVLFMLFTNGHIQPPDILNFLYENGGLLFRSYSETRGDYVDEFLTEFNFFDLHNEHWNLPGVPQTESGFYDLHNSFLTIVVRDSYLGLFKDILWAFQIFFIPLGVFLGVSLRAAHDTFLLGGVCDIVLYALIGRSIKESGHSMMILVKMKNMSKKLMIINSQKSG